MLPDEALGPVEVIDLLTDQRFVGSEHVAELRLLAQALEREMDRSQRAASRRATYRSQPDGTLNDFERVAVRFCSRLGSVLADAMSTEYSGLLAEMAESLGEHMRRDEDALVALMRAELSL